MPNLTIPSRDDDADDGAQHNGGGGELFFSLAVSTKRPAGTAARQIIFDRFNLRYHPFGANFFVSRSAAMACTLGLGPCLPGRVVVVVVRLPPPACSSRRSCGRLVVVGADCIHHYGGARDKARLRIYSNLPFLPQRRFCSLWEMGWSRCKSKFHPQRGDSNHHLGSTAFSTFGRPLPPFRASERQEKRRGGSCIQPPPWPRHVASLHLYSFATAHLLYSLPTTALRQLSATNLHQPQHDDCHATTRHHDLPLRQEQQVLSAGSSSGFHPPPHLGCQQQHLAPRPSLLWTNRYRAFAHHPA